MSITILIGLSCFNNGESRRLIKMKDANTQNRVTGNIKIGLLLFSAVILIFSITIVKLKQGSLMQGYDHVLRQNLVEKNDN